MAKRKKKKICPIKQQICNFVAENSAIFNVVNADALIKLCQKAGYVPKDLFK